MVLLDGGKCFSGDPEEYSFSTDSDRFVLLSLVWLQSGDVMITRAPPLKPEDPRTKETRWKLYIEKPSDNNDLK